MRTALSLVPVVVALWAGIAGAQTRACMDFGPERSPSRALRPDASRREICARQAASDRRREDERQDEVYRKRWRDALHHAVLPAPVAPIAAWPNGAAPVAYVTDDGRTLVLLDEVDGPADRRRPEISMGTDDRTGSPLIRIAGPGIAPLPAIDLTCAWSRRSIPLTDFSIDPRRPVASYHVTESIAALAPRRAQLSPRAGRHRRVHPA